MMLKHPPAIAATEETPNSSGSQLYQQQVLTVAQCKQEMATGQAWTRKQIPKSIIYELCLDWVMQHLHISPLVVLLFCMRILSAVWRKKSRKYTSNTARQGNCYRELTDCLAVLRGLLLQAACLPSPGRSVISHIIPSMEEIFALRKWTIC